jgi:small subunit ribosomal protein S8
MDPIANMIISLKNAGNSGLETVSLPFSKVKEAIAETLKKEGFIRSYEKKTKSGKPVLEVGLILENRIPKVKGVKRISKTSKRIYLKSGDIRAVKNGYGALIISTPNGIMTGRDAKKAKVGGEALFTIW